MAQEALTLDDGTVTTPSEDAPRTPSTSVILMSSYGDGREFQMITG
jgi:hypothetical protein